MNLNFFFLPGEAEVAVAGSLFDRQHIGVWWAGKQEFSNFKGLRNPETSSLSRAVELLNSLDEAGHCTVKQAGLTS